MLIYLKAVSYIGSENTYWERRTKLSSNLDLYYLLGKITSRERPKYIVSYQRPHDILQTSLYGSVKLRNTQAIRTPHKCYITKVVSIAH